MKQIYTTTNYLSVDRFISLQQQINTILQLKSINKICEIGKGNGFFNMIVKSLGYNVLSVDYDKSLEPDIHCSVLDLKQKIDEKFDAVVAFQVLEHIPFENFELALENMKSISKKYVIISLPFAGITAKLLFYLFKHKPRFLHLSYRIPMFWKKHIFHGEHYWEIGKKGYPRKKIKNLLKKHFILKNEWLLPSSHYHIFYLCEIK